MKPSTITPSVLHSTLLKNNSYFKKLYREFHLVRSEELCFHLMIHPKPVYTSKSSSLTSVQHRNKEVNKKSKLNSLVQNFHSSAFGSETYKRSQISDSQSKIRCYEKKSPSYLSALKRKFSVTKIIKQIFRSDHKKNVNDKENWPENLMSSLSQSKHFVPIEDTKGIVLKPRSVFESLQKKASQAPNIHTTRTGQQLNVCPIHLSKTVTSDKLINKSIPNQPIHSKQNHKNIVKHLKSDGCEKISCPSIQQKSNLNNALKLKSSGKCSENSVLSKSQLPVMHCDTSQNNIKGSSPTYNGFKMQGLKNTFFNNSNSKSIITNQSQNIDKNKVVKSIHFTNNKITKNVNISKYYPENTMRFSSSKLNNKSNNIFKKNNISQNLNSKEKKIIKKINLSVNENQYMKLNTPLILKEKSSSTLSNSNKSNLSIDCKSKGQPKGFQTNKSDCNINCQTEQKFDKSKLMESVNKNTKLGLLPESKNKENILKSNQVVTLNENQLSNAPIAKNLSSKSELNVSSKEMCEKKIKKPKETSDALLMNTSVVNYFLQKSCLFTAKNNLSVEKNVGKPSSVFKSPSFDKTSQFISKEFSPINDSDKNSHGVVGSNFKAFNNTPNLQKNKKNVSEKYELTKNRKDNSDKRCERVHNNTFITSSEFVSKNETNSGFKKEDLSPKINSIGLSVSGNNNISCKNNVSPGDFKVVNTNNIENKTYEKSGDSAYVTSMFQKKELMNNQDKINNFVVDKLGEKIPKLESISREISDDIQAPVVLNNCVLFNKTITYSSPISDEVKPSGISGDNPLVKNQLNTNLTSVNSQHPCVISTKNPTIISDKKPDVNSETVNLELLVKTENGQSINEEKPEINLDNKYKITSISFKDSNESSNTKDDLSLKQNLVISNEQELSLFSNNKQNNSSESKINMGFEQHFNLDSDLPGSSNFIAPQISSSPVIDNNLIKGDLMKDETAAFDICDVDKTIGSKKDSFTIQLLDMIKKIASVILNQSSSLFSGKKLSNQQTVLIEQRTPSDKNNSVKKLLITVEDVSDVKNEETNVNKCVTQLNIDQLSSQSENNVSSLNKTCEKVSSDQPSKPKPTPEWDSTITISNDQQALAKTHCFCKAATIKSASDVLIKGFEKKLLQSSEPPSTENLQTTVIVPKLPSQESSIKSETSNNVQTSDVTSVKKINYLIESKTPKFNVSHSEIKKSSSLNQIVEASDECLTNNLSKKKNVSFSTDQTPDNVKELVKNMSTQKSCIKNNITSSTDSLTPKKCDPQNIIKGSLEHPKIAFTLNNICPKKIDSKKKTSGVPQPKLIYKANVKQKKNNNTPKQSTDYSSLKIKKSMVEKVLTIPEEPEEKMKSKTFKENCKTEEPLKRVDEFLQKFSTNDPSTSNSLGLSENLDSTNFEVLNTNSNNLSTDESLKKVDCLNDKLSPVESVHKNSSNTMPKLSNDGKSLEILSNLSTFHPLFSTIVHKYEDQNTTAVKSFSSEIPLENNALNVDSSFECSLFKRNNDLANLQANTEVVNQKLESVGNKSNSIIHPLFSSFSNCYHKPSEPTKINYACPYSPMVINEKEESISIPISPISKGLSSKVDERKCCALFVPENESYRPLSIFHSKEQNLIPVPESEIPFHDTFNYEMSTSVTCLSSDQPVLNTYAKKYRKKSLLQNYESLFMEHTFAVINNDLTKSDEAVVNFNGSSNYKKISFTTTKCDKVNHGKQRKNLVEKTRIHNSAVSLNVEDTKVNDEHYFVGDNNKETSPTSLELRTTQLNMPKGKHNRTQTKLSPFKRTYRSKVTFIKKNEKAFSQSERYYRIRSKSVTSSKSLNTSNAFFLNDIKASPKCLSFVKSILNSIKTKSDVNISVNPDINEKSALEKQKKYLNSQYADKACDSKYTELEINNFQNKVSDPKYSFLNLNISKYCLILNSVPTEFKKHDEKINIEDSTDATKRSILDLFRTVDKTAVIIQKDFYTRDKLFKKIEEDEKMEKEKALNKTVKAASCTVSDEFISHETDRTVLNRFSSLKDEDIKKESSHIELKKDSNYCYSDIDVEKFQPLEYGFYKFLKYDSFFSTVLQPNYGNDKDEIENIRFNVDSERNKTSSTEINDCFTSISLDNTKDIYNDPKDQLQSKENSKISSFYYKEETKEIKLNENDLQSNTGSFFHKDPSKQIDSTMTQSSHDIVSNFWIFSNDPKKNQILVDVTVDSTLENSPNLVEKTLTDSCNTDASSQDSFDKIMAFHVELKPNENFKPDHNSILINTLKHFENNLKLPESNEFCSSLYDNSYLSQRPNIVLLTNDNINEGKVKDPLSNNSTTGLTADNNFIMQKDGSNSPPSFPVDKSSSSTSINLKTFDSKTEVSVAENSNKIEPGSSIPSILKSFFQVSGCSSKMKLQADLIENTKKSLLGINSTDCSNTSFEQGKQVSVSHSVDNLHVPPGNLSNKNKINGIYLQEKDNKIAEAHSQNVLSGLYSQDNKDKISETKHLSLNSNNEDFKPVINVTNDYPVITVQLMLDRSPKINTTNNLKTENKAKVIATTSPSHTETYDDTIDKMRKKFISNSFRSDPKFPVQRFKSSYDEKISNSENKKDKISVISESKNYDYNPNNNSLSEKDYKLLENYFYNKTNYSNKKTNSPKSNKKSLKYSPKGKIKKAKADGMAQTPETISKFKELIEKYAHENYMELSQYTFSVVSPTEFNSKPSVHNKITPLSEVSDATIDSYSILKPKPVKLQDIKQSEKPSGIINLDLLANPILKEKYLSLPSVSKILNQTMSDSAKLALDKWKIRMIEAMGEEKFKEFHQEQLNRGKDFHEIIKNHFLGKTEFLDKQKSNLCYKSIEGILKDMNDVVAVESFVVHPALGYKGIFDCLAIYKNKPVLIEWKHTNKKKNKIGSIYDAPVQLSAYVGALSEDKNYNFQVEGGVIVVAHADGTPAEVFELNMNEIQNFWEIWLQRLKQYINGQKTLTSG